ncbi:metal-dependent hydrolase [Culicoidibacter larvae]|uniref:UPF0173 metal-dependent hydrolase FEZ08_03645 n=1 Tax=Culicoidibacter larvae TaxID=2579976 RepID=A0A5R8QG90_9FIRM|nr:metal-dependent hydrolase [Culicoidibacter larvae]TLG76720.1 metal-dependent hydrolase [Culicoidibacter larvae]
MKVTYLGHSAVLLEDGDKHIIIDPFLSGNPLFKGTLDDIPKLDAILLTHGHNDHFGDTIELADRDGALIVCMVEIADFIEQHFEVDTHGLNIGGGYQFDFGKVTLVPAIHSSSINDKNGNIHYLGLAAGIVFESGTKAIYHAGDTALFSDMQLLNRYDLDLAFLPIGDNYTMGIDDAVQAAEWIEAQKVVPVHYNTFPIIQQDPHIWARHMVEIGQHPHILDAGEMVLI